MSENAQKGGSSGGDGEQERKSDTGGGDVVQSCEDVLCFDRRPPLVTTALGLMGFQVPQVCDLMMKHWMDTVHTLLLHDSLTAPKLRRILENVDVVLRDIGGPQLLELVEILLKAAVQMKNMSPKSSLESWTFVRTKCNEGGDAAWAIEKILEHVLREKEVVYNHLSPIARLQVWRFRPSLLKVDLADLANEAMQRPMLSLKVESGSCRTLGFMVATLALAPDLLNEVRRLLLTWSTFVRAVRLLELRAQLTVAVHGILQFSDAPGTSLSDEGVWLHTLHSSSLRPFLQLLVGVPSVSALNHLVELMERQESSNREIGVRKCERSPKRQRKSYDQDESLDDSSSNMPDILGAKKEATRLRTNRNALFPTKSWNQDGVNNCPLWTLLADFLPWSAFASQLLFQDPDVSTANRQTAADFLSWLMCPSSPEGRAFATTEFLHAAEDWQSLCNETQPFRSPAGVRRFLDSKEIGKDDSPHTICSLCGSPINWTGDLANGAPHYVSNSSALQNLIAWLLRLCRLESDLQQIHLKGCKDVSKHPSHRDRMYEVIRVFPIAAFASNSNALLTPEVGGLLLSMILLGLTSRFKQEPPPRSKEKPLSPRSCCTECDDFHCMSCCSKDRHRSSEPPHRTEQIKDDARMEEEEEKEKEEDDIYWAPFAAALFTFLDYNLFAGCAASSSSSAEPQSLATSNPKQGIIGRVVAACVHHWVQLTSQSTAVMNSHRIVDTVYHRRIQMLEDLHTRVVAWAADATGADTELAQAAGNLKRQIEQFKSFL